MFAAIVGLVLSTIAVYLREVLDQSVRSPTRVWTAIGLPILETIGPIRVGPGPGLVGWRLLRPSLAAVGLAGVDNLDLDKVEIFLGDVCIVSQGGRDARYSEEKGQAIMDSDEITVRIVLGRGKAYARVWTCDLSYDYVRINAEYRT